MAILLSLIGPIVNSYFPQRHSTMRSVIQRANILRLLRAAALLACLTGFVLNSGETFEKYFNGSTLVLSSTEDMQKDLPLPVFVICNYSAFKAGLFFHNLPVFAGKGFVLNCLCSCGEKSGPAFEYLGVSYPSFQKMYKKQDCV